MSPPGEGRWLRCSGNLERARGLLSEAHQKLPPTDAAPASALAELKRACLAREMAHVDGRGPSRQSQSGAATADAPAVWLFLPYPDTHAQVTRTTRFRNAGSALIRVGRFAQRPSATGERVTRYNALFHWRVAAGREIEAGKEIGRHHILTHAYWREGGPEFADVNVMAVAHGTDKALILEHKAAIDRHLEEADIAVLYSNVFWGGRSEIKPSEISPVEYAKWAQRVGLAYERSVV